MRLFRAAALIAITVGAAGAVVLFFRAADHPPPLLVVLFILWLLSPFAVLTWAQIASTRWSVPTQTALHVVTVVITLASLAIYARLLVVAPPGAPKAAVFVVTPPASWLLMALVVALVALIFRNGQEHR